MCVFSRGTLRDTGLLLSSLASFIASTRLNRSRVCAIDSPDQSRQVFDQYDTSEVSEKFSWATFRWIVVKKCWFLVFSRFANVSGVQGIQVCRGEILTFCFSSWIFLLSHYFRKSMVRGANFNQNIWKFQHYLQINHFWLRLRVATAAQLC